MEDYVLFLVIEHLKKKNTDLMDLRVIEREKLTYPYNGKQIMNFLKIEEEIHDKQIET